MNNEKITTTHNRRSEFVEKIMKQQREFEEKLRAKLMNEDRLAEIEKECEKYDTEEQENIIDLIQALRAERLKVAELRKELTRNEYRIANDKSLIRQLLDQLAIDEP